MTIAVVVLLLCTLAASRWWIRRCRRQRPDVLDLAAAAQRRQGFTEALRLDGRAALARKFEPIAQLGSTN